MAYAPKFPIKLAAMFYKELYALQKQADILVSSMFKTRAMPLLKKRQLLNRQAVTANTLQLDLTDIRNDLNAIVAQVNAMSTTLSTQLDAIYNSNTVQRIGSSFVNDIFATQRAMFQRNLVNSVHTSQQRRQAIAVMPLTDAGIAKLAQGYAQYASELIKTIPAQYHARVRDRMLKAVENGEYPDTVWRDLQAFSQISERRARFIARDQLGTIFGLLEDARMSNMGIYFYEWLTSHDERVRPSHQALDGKICDVRTGAQPNTAPAISGTTVVGKNPGEDYNCRCVRLIGSDAVESFLAKQEEQGYFDQYETNLDQSDIEAITGSLSQPEKPAYTPKTTLTDRGKELREDLDAIIKQIDSIVESESIASATEQYQYADTQAISQANRTGLDITNSAANELEVAAMEIPEIFPDKPKSLALSQAWRTIKKLKIEFNVPPALKTEIIEQHKKIKKSIKQTATVTPTHTEYTRNFSTARVPKDPDDFASYAMETLLQDTRKSNNSFLTLENMWFIAQYSGAEHDYPGETSFSLFRRAFIEIFPETYNAIREAVKRHGIHATYAG